MITLHFTEVRCAPKAHPMVGPQCPQLYLWKKANPRKSSSGAGSSWSFSFFRGRQGYFLSPSLQLSNMSGTSLPQILKGDFSISVLHEGGRVWNHMPVLGNLCRASKKIYLPFMLSWPTVFQLSLPPFLHLHSSWFRKIFSTVHQKGRIVPANLCCEGEVRFRHRGIWTQSGHSVL